MSDHGKHKKDKKSKFKSSFKKGFNKSFTSQIMGIFSSKKDKDKKKK